ncbi:E3 ubiquitin-protein ligase TRIM4 [Phytophthora cinnamomi]|uniref:E3 ubiquitin-protein ligase TRIM4 n=1 Tax=Phytophthora cinnamomi TaxID=4785 RepID=UPI00355A2F75|nr:E3 ubiquitin-protein ligase TRIM4 [Phytophthora cinnamomi]
MASASFKRLPRPLQLAIEDAAHRRRPSLAITSTSSPGRARVALEDLRCSICFDVLSFPVTLPCGHNFDRGCILTAWAHDAAAASPRAALPSPRPSPATSEDEDDAAAAQAAPVTPRGRLPRAAEQLRGHLCPLCRQQAGVHKAEELQVNLLLKDLIASLYPAETQSAATPAKQQSSHLTLPSSPRVGVGALTTNTAASAFRRRPSVRTFSSFVYVCAASVTDPPGFVLAVLLLLVLLATACSPQPAAAPPAASAMVMFDTMDRVCNGLSLLIHRISMQMDQMDQVSPWIRIISYLI